jgi:hypothetical protein
MGIESILFRRVAVKLDIVRIGEWPSRSPVVFKGCRSENGYCEYLEGRGTIRIDIGGIGKLLTFTDCFQRLWGGKWETGRKLVIDCLIELIFRDGSEPVHSLLKVITGASWIIPITYGTLTLSKYMELAFNGSKSLHSE